MGGRFDVWRRSTTFLLSERVDVITGAQPILVWYRRLLRKCRRFVSTIDIVDSTSNPWYRLVMRLPMLTLSNLSFLRPSSTVSLVLVVLSIHSSPSTLVSIDEFDARGAIRHIDVPYRYVLSSLDMLSTFVQGYLILSSSGHHCMYYLSSVLRLMRPLSFCPFHVDKSIANLITYFDGW
jgi:hypothetical protein